MALPLRNETPAVTIDAECGWYRILVSAYLHRRQRGRQDAPLQPSGNDSEINQHNGAQHNAVDAEGGEGVLPDVVHQAPDHQQAHQEADDAAHHQNADFRAGGADTGQQIDT